LDNLNLLQSAIENGIIDLTHIQNQVYMAKRVKYLKQHNYSMWQGKDGKWCTYLPDENKGRRFVKKNTKQEMEDAVVKYYSDLENAVITLSFKDVYYEWRSLHDKTVQSTSVAKYITDAKRYFDNNEAADQDITSFTKESVKVFIKELIDKLHLCKSATKRLYEYVDNVFSFAEERGYIDKSPTRYLKAKDMYGYCYESERSKKPKVFSKDDLAILAERFKKDHLKKPNYIPSYAVEFAALTGMRVGEIAALSWDCVFDNYFVINKSEKYDPPTNSYYIAKTKNKKDRIFPITPQIRELLDTVKRIEEEYGYLCEWVFADYEGRLTFRKISSCLKNKCRQCGISARGIHTYRKTLNSNLEHDGVPSTVRATLLGHTKEVNETYYTFDVSDIDEKMQIITNVNQHMNSCGASA